MGSNRESSSAELDDSDAARSRDRFRILGRSGAVVGFVLVVVASGLAFALTDSTAARTTLPPQVEIAGTTTTTLPSVVTTTPPATTTTVVISTSTSTTSAPTSTSAPTTTTLPQTLDTGKTIVVKTVPTVRVEDDNGKQLDYEGSETASGASDDTSGKDH
jgi:hypothetical protein